MADSNDQAQVAGDEGTPTGDAPETQATKQSDEQADGERETKEMFDLPDGRKVDAPTLSKEWKENFYPEFTRRSQKIKEYERAAEEAKSRATQQTREAVAENDLLKGIDPSIKEAVIQIVTPVIQQHEQQVKEENAQLEKDKAFDAELGRLEKAYPGGNGLPKFDRNSVIAKMQDPSNRNFDPESLFFALYKGEFKDVWVREALKQQRGGAQLEATGQAEDRKPTGSSPRTWDEARRSASSRI